MSNSLIDRLTGPLDLITEKIMGIKYSNMPTKLREGLAHHILTQITERMNKLSKYYGYIGQAPGLHDDQVKCSMLEIWVEDFVEVNPEGFMDLLRKCVKSYKIIVANEVPKVPKGKKPVKGKNAEKEVYDRYLMQR